MQRLPVVTQLAAAPALCSPKARRLGRAGLTYEVADGVSRALLVPQAVRHVARSLRRDLR